MTPQRNGEIALALLKYQKSKDGAPLDRETFRRGLPKLAEALGVPEQELTEFAELNKALVHNLVQGS